MIYLKQVKLLDPDLVAGDPEELKYPYKAPAVQGDSPRRESHGRQRRDARAHGAERHGKIHPAGSDDE